MLRALVLPATQTLPEIQTLRRRDTRTTRATRGRLQGNSASLADAGFHQTPRTSVLAAGRLEAPLPSQEPLLQRASGCQPLRITQAGGLGTCCSACRAASPCASHKPEAEVHAAVRFRLPAPALHTSRKLRYMPKRASGCQPLRVTRAGSLGTCSPEQRNCSC